MLKFIGHTVWFIRIMVIFYLCLLCSYNFSQNGRLLCDYCPVKTTFTSLLITKLFKSNYFLILQLLDKIPHKFSSTTKSPCWENSETGFRLFCLPYFYLIGAPKSATTDLWSKIMFHPDVVKSLDKEPQFWTRGNLGKFKSSMDCIMK